jgi:uncharacterized protein YjbI with pentapeptide repeats
MRADNGSLGAWSPVSVSVTPAAAPGIPSAVVATAGNARVSLKWTAPSTNGANITDYYIQWRLSGGGSWTTFGDGANARTSAVVTGLTNGTSYDFRVAALNSVGLGSYTDGTTTSTPVASPPSAPTNLTGVIGDSQVSLSWTAPSSNGGAPLVTYVVQYSSDSRTWTTFDHAPTTTVTLAVTGLTNRTAYVFRVAAINKVDGTILDAGVFSAVSSEYTPLGAASLQPAPTTVQGTASNSQVVLTWIAPLTAPNTDTIPAVTGYRIERSVNGGGWTVQIADTGSAALTATVTGLVNGSTYRFRVSAINTAGTGVASRSTMPFVPALTANCAIRVAGANLSNCNLIGVSLRNVDLTGANLTGANLSSADLTGANLTNATINYALLYGTTLSYATLTGASLKGSFAEGANFTGAVLTATTVLTAVNLRGANFSYATLANVDFTNLFLNGASFINSNLTNAVFVDARSPGADFRYANLTGANFTRARLTVSNMSFTFMGTTNLTDASLQSATLTNVDLRTSIVTRTNWQDATLTSVNLSGRNLTGANFASTNMSSVHLAGSTLDGATLRGATANFGSMAGASLIGVNFRGSSMIRVNFTGAVMHDSDGGRANFTKANFT